MLLGKSADKPIIELIKDASDVEIGFKISGVATTYDQVNENGGVFKAGDFDKFIRDYFKKNKLNMVCPIEHCWNDFDNRGVFSLLDSNDQTLNVVVEFYKDCCSKYDTIKGQVNRGILQGFSTYGWYYDVGNGKQREAILSNISLVSQPSDAGAKLDKDKLFTNSTQFVGFGEIEVIGEPKKIFLV